MGKLGFDIVAADLNETDRLFCKQAISNYNSFKNLVWHGDLFRLVNPHENDISALMYVNPEKSKAIVFNYLVNNRFMMTATRRPVVLDGLDPTKKYKLKEINLYPEKNSSILSDKVYTGDFLMKVGINPNVNLLRTSVLIEINEVN
jgi:alpha-galactosidase